MKHIDIVIIGAGPAGLTAALYLARANKKVIVLDKSAPGGKLLTIPFVNNYPGVPSSSGLTLAQSFLASVNAFHVPFEYGSVSFVRKENGLFFVETDADSYLAKAVIVATGLTNVPAIPGEKEFIHKGVSYCATCDGRFFKDRPMAVVGENEHALSEAIYLSSLANIVYLFFDKEVTESSPYFEALKNPKIKIIKGAKSLKIHGENHVDSLEYVLNGDNNTIEISAIFPLSKEKSAISFLSPLEVKTNKGFITTDEGMESSVKGVFAIGDIREKKLRQIVTAASDGAIASSSVISYLSSYGK